MILVECLRVEFYLALQDFAFQSAGRTPPSGAKMYLQ
jgi:hypothetical protein